MTVLVELPIEAVYATKRVLVQSAELSARDPFAVHAALGLR
ncbi:hypothetical protein [Kutzneria sp. NPDC052558]